MAVDILVFVLMWTPQYTIACIHLRNIGKSSITNCFSVNFHVQMRLETSTSVQGLDGRSMRTKLQLLVSDSFFGFGILQSQRSAGTFEYLKNVLSYLCKITSN